jgi:hypothetical protein
MYLERTPYNRSNAGFQRPQTLDSFGCEHYFVRRYSSDYIIAWRVGWIERSETRHPPANVHVSITIGNAIGTRGLSRVMANPLFIAEDQNRID